MTMAKKKNAPANGARDEFTTLMLQRASDAFAFDSEQRRKVKEDMEFAFVPGNQWDTHMTKKRRNRPCYEFNRTRQLIRRVTGQQLKNKPQIKVRATEDNDTDTADIYNGLIKNIEVQSSAETAYDTAFQWSCGGGYGVLRVVADYEQGDTFDQCLQIKAVHDPLTVFPDPAARELDWSDGRYVFVTEIIPLEEFKRRWPNAKAVDFEQPGADEYDREWWFDDTVRIAEYWYIEEERRRIYLLDNGAVVDADEFDPIKDEAASPQDGLPPLTIKAEREVIKPCVYSALVCGSGKLEEPAKWGGKMIPIVPQWGDVLTIAGKKVYSGMTRFGKDSQRVHNFEVSTLIEVIAKLPNSPLMATPGMIKGLESYYERMGYDDPPVMLYNVDPAAPGGSPQRQPMAQFPAALANMSALATDELKANLGVYDASIGARTNETSGKAILARQSEGEISNFVYIDNQVKALKRLGEILVDAIPAYYDAERSIRILGEDGAEKFVQVNRPMVDQQTGQTFIVNDLTRGKYDVTVTVGKGFDTARMELAEAAQALSVQSGPFGMLGQFLLLKTLDLPGMDEYVAAARKVLVGMKLLDPGEGDQPPPPPQPNPKDVADAKAKDAAARKSLADAQQTELETQITAYQFGAQVGAAAPPIQTQPIAPQEPPPGGFFMGNGQYSPQDSGTAPDGIPG